MSIYVGNTFGCNMLKELTCTVDFKEISWEKFDEIISGDFINFYGHEDIARLVGLNTNRISISVGSGDIVVFTQYRGERLPEGATELPEGATIVPVMATIK